MRIFNSLIIALSLLYGCAAFAGEPLSRREAQSAIKLATKLDIKPGSYRLTGASKSQDGKDVTFTQLRKVSEDGKVLQRTETVSTWTTRTGKHRTRTKTKLQNADGKWTLEGNLAVLTPPAFTEEVLREIQEVGPEAWLKDTESKGPVPDVIRAMVFAAQHTTYSSDKLVENSRNLISITALIDKEGLERMEKAMRIIMKEAKKALPFAVRLIAGPILASMDVEGKLPARTVYVIDPESGRLVRKLTYNADGKLLSTSKEPQYEVVSELSDSLFAIPPGMVVRKPATLGEMFEILGNDPARKEPAPGAKAAAPEAEGDQ